MDVSVLDKPFAKSKFKGSGGTDKKVIANYQRVVGNEVENAILRTMAAFRVEILKSTIQNH